VNTHSAAIVWFFAACSACRSAPDAAPAPAASHTAIVTHPGDTLDAMDTRVPVPLLPMMAHHQKQNMRDHLEAVREIAAAVAESDFDAVGRAAKRIGFSEQMGRMCEHMGRGAPGFTELALEFHHRADAIGAAAKANDPTAVLTALGDTLAVCTSCHARFKQRIVADASFGPPAGH